MSDQASMPEQLRMSDAAFASPDIYEFLEDESFLYPLMDKSSGSSRKLTALSVRSQAACAMLLCAMIEPP